MNSNGAGAALNSNNISFGTLLASIGAGAAAFAVQFTLFNILRLRFKRIYAPKTYLVPEKERVPDARPGIFGWIVSLFKTSNMEFIEKCGLDAYFFLRYLRMLLKIFVPTACLLLPILLPVNNVGIDPDAGTDIRGVNKFSVSNIGQKNQGRKWVHLVAILFFDVFVCYIMFGELRGYIRIRQAYLTSPQHRLRASATTVLVTNISRKWLTREALDGLYDVFPGGIRNIWINRNFDELDQLVQTRDSMARNLEDHYSSLVEKAHKAYYKQSDEAPLDDTIGAETGPGISSGNPHQIAHNLDEALGREGSGSSDILAQDKDKKRIPVFSDVADGFGVVGHGLGQGVDAVGQGFNRFGNMVRGGVTDTFARGRRTGPAEHEPQLTEGIPPLQQDGQNEYFDHDTATQDPNARISATSDEFAAIPATQSAQASSSYDRQLSKRGLSLHLKNLGDKYPSPQPKQREGDEYPLQDLNGRGSADSTIDVKVPEPRSMEKKKAIPVWSAIVGFFVNSLESEMPTKQEILELTKAETARRQRLTEVTDAEWKKHVKESDRDTTHEHTSPLLNWIPYVGTKVDAIDYLTVRLAVYNRHIEHFQKDPERFELMNSAFIQFNHQVAAHMACQSLNHHVPLQMTPRTVEISPDDVKWGALSTSWWLRYIRTTLVVLGVIGLIIAYTPLVAFTGALSQIDTVSDNYPFLDFVNTWSESVKSVVQGVLPPAILGLLLVLLPLFMRLLTAFQGVTTGSQLERTVQVYYFVFLFLQLFVVVSISTGLSTIINLFSKDGGSQITDIPTILATQLPQAANYFFSYIVLQALSVSAGAILQVVNLFLLYVWSKIFDSSPRAKFNRATTLPTINWGTFFPVYTNLAVIGIVYSIIAPLIMVFVIITFSIFWIVHRYNALYVNRYTNDTGGLLFPRAVVQLFTGLYFMHIIWFGLFLLATDTVKNRACFPQAIIVAVCIPLLAGYQFILKQQFSPLYRYIPITMEDEAVERDEQYEALQARKYEEGYDAAEDVTKLESDNLQQALRDRERREKEESEALAEADRRRIEAKKEARRSSGQGPSSSQHLSPRLSPQLSSHVSPTISPNKPDRKNSWLSRSSQSQGEPATAAPDKSWAKRENNDKPFALDGAVLSAAAGRIVPPRLRHRSTNRKREEDDVEAQKPVEERFYHDMNDELEDLTKEERDILVNKAFQHRALRANRPAVWIPKDKVGLSDFEIMLIASSDELKQYIWISNEGAGLKRNGKVNGSTLMRPPDFNEENLIKL